MGWWLITKFCSQIQNGYQLIWKYFSRIPIPLGNTGILSNEQAGSLCSQMLSLNSQLQEKRSRFLRRLGENLGEVKITTALQTFDQMDFADFLKELKKQKIKLTLTQQDEWEDYFRQYAEQARSLCSRIAATDQEIDRRVYELYGLTEEEIKIVEGA